MSTMSREQFEEWLSDHQDEALALIEPDRLSLSRWIQLFGKSLQAEARNEHEDASDDEDDDEGDGDELLFDDVG